MRKLEIAFVSMIALCASSASAQWVPFCLPFGAHIWIDPAMTVATGIDYFATKNQQEKTVDASDAISQLEEALGSSSGSGSSSGGGSTSGDTSTATAYTVDSIISQIEVKKGSASTNFCMTNLAE